MFLGDSCFNVVNQMVVYFLLFFLLGVGGGLLLVEKKINEYVGYRDVVLDWKCLVGLCVVLVKLVFQCKKKCVWDEVGDGDGQ